MTCLFGTQFDTSADIYEEYTTDNVATGQRIRDWQFVGTVSCKVAPLNTRISLSDRERIAETYELPTSILVTTANKMPLTHRLTNITAGSTVLYTENDNEPTVFEVESYKPVMDPYGAPVAFEHICRRSSNQKVYP